MDSGPQPYPRSTPETAPVFFDSRMGFRPDGMVGKGIFDVLVDWDCRGKN